MSEKKVGAGIGIMILKNNKLLLGKRNEDPEKASSLLHGEGTWTMPGGKMHFGESFEEAGKREVFEETGIKVKDLEVISVSNEIVEDAHFITIGLLCRDFKGETRTMEPEEIVEWKWFPLDKLPEKILKNYLEKEFYKY